MEVSDEAILEAVSRLSAARGQGTLANVLAFGRALKEVGLRIGLSQVMDAGRALEFVDIGSRFDFRAVLRSNLISAKEEIPLFDRVFDCFWRECGPETPAKESLPAPSAREKGGESEGAEGVSGETAQEELGPEEKTGEEAERSQLAAYSPLETLQKKDFSSMGIEESRAVSRAILLIANKIATQVSRRKKRAAKGEEIDPRWTMRKSLRHGGEIIELVPRKRRIKKTRVVLLCDVSGSMDCYSRFLIQFMYGLQNELWGVETFVFSTSLTRITHLLRTRDIGSALERISVSVLGWSGGTNIGRSLYAFNRGFAASLVNHRTVVVIISDGWDRGDVGLLEGEMKTIQRRCHKVIWLNPLLASENYEPLCRGMQAALPYIGLFLSVHNLSSLIALGRTLQKLVA